MGSRCSNLLPSDNACDIVKCQEAQSTIPEWNVVNMNSYWLDLKEGTKYQGKKLPYVAYSVGQTTQLVIHLCSFIKQVVDQGVCPFLAPVYSIGYNCKKSVVILHGVPLGKLLKDWWLTEDVSLLDKQLIVFQLLYVCHVLQLGNYPQGLHAETLYVVTLKAPKTWRVATESSFFEFTTLYSLRVSALPLFPPSADMSTVSDFSSKAGFNFVGVQGSQGTLLQLGRQLNIVSPGFPWDEHAIGVSPSFFKPPLSDVYQTLQSFTFTPTSSETATLLRKQSQLRRQIAEFSK